MGRPKVYATPAARQAAYRARCAAIPECQRPVLPAVPGSRRWAVLLGQARGLLEQVAEEMATYAAARSEAWQESERGESFTERCELLDETLDLLQALAES